MFILFLVRIFFDTGDVICLLLGGKTSFTILSYHLRKKQVRRFTQIERSTYFFY